MLKAVRRLSVADAVYEQLRESIVSGRLAPGTELPGERALSETLQVNRGAVREALKRLEQIRLVALHPGGVGRVLDFRESATLELVTQLIATPGGDIDPRVARSVIELRLALNPEVARLAALRGGPELAPALRALVDEMYAELDADQRLVQLGRQFWEILVSHTGNVAYRLIFNTLREVHERCEDLLPAPEGSPPNLASYQRLLESVEKRDPDLAAQAARDQCRPIAERLTQGVPELQGGAG